MDQKQSLYSRDFIECLTNWRIGSKNTEIIQVSSLRKSSYAFCSYKSKFSASTILSKNLQRFFVPQAQIWFAARSAPVKTSNSFCSLLLLPPVCEIYTMPPTVKYKIGMQGLEPWTSATQTQRSAKLSYIPRYWTEAQPLENNMRKKKGIIKKRALCSVNVGGRIRTLGPVTVA